MRDEDRAAFARMLFAVGDTFNEPVSELRAEAYFDALNDLPIADVLAAGRRAIAESRFFPRPVELREMIDGTMDEAAEIAWGKVQRLVRSVGYTGTPAWPDEPTRRAALELYGGWVRLCSSLPADGPELLGYRKQFVATYKAYAARDRREMAALPPSSVAGYIES
jgi:hypothetical protein